LQAIDKDMILWVIDEAQKLGADEVECYVSLTKSYFVQIMTGEIRQPIYTVEGGLGIRVVTDRRIGFSSTNIFEKETIRETIKKALSVARASKPNPKWVSLPQKEKYPSVPKLYDKRIEDMTADEVLDHAKIMVTSALNVDKRIIPVWGGVAISIFEEIVANSHNVYGANRGTFFGGSLGVIAREDDKTTPIHSESAYSRSLDIKLENVGIAVAEKTIKSLTTTRIGTGDYPVILAPEALTMLMMFTLIRSLEADFVQLGRSPFANRVGQEIAASSFTVIDDGTLAGGVSSAPFDDEGSPTKRKVLIDKGVLRGFMYDNYTAKIENKESTGNGIRAGAWYSQAQPKYQFTPTVFPTNFIVGTGDSSLNEMISDIDLGILVLGVQGAHSSNPETGEVSVVATPAWKIENGEVKGLIPGLMMNMNIYDAIKQVELISKESKRVYNMILPWIKFRSIRMISKQ